MANLSNARFIYKQLRPSNVLKFEKIVAETVRVLEEEYLNPFGATLVSTIRVQVKHYQQI